MTDGLYFLKGLVEFLSGYDCSNSDINAGLNDMSRQ